MKRKHTSNPVTFIIGTIFLLSYVLYSASQTWLLVEWLFPTDALVMKILTLVTFDVSALFWFLLHQFHRPATEGSKTFVVYGSIIDFILSILATGFYLVLHYVTHYNGMVDPNLVTSMYITVLVALIVNIIFVACWWTIEWSAYHPNDVVFPDDREVYSHPQTSVYSPAKIEVLEAPKVDKTEDLSTNKPVYSPDLSTNKSIPPTEVSTNKKKLPQLKRREFLGGKSQTKNAN